MGHPNRSSRRATYDLLPKACAAKHPVDGRWILIRKGEDGYHEWPSPNLRVGQGEILDPETFNRMHDIDDAIIEIMVIGSMRGWDRLPTPTEMRTILRKGRERKEREQHRLGGAQRRWAET